MALELIDGIPPRVLAGMEPAEWRTVQTEARADAEAMLAAIGSPPVGAWVHHPVEGIRTVLKIWRGDQVRVSWKSGKVTAVLPTSFDDWEGKPVGVLDILTPHPLDEVIAEDHQLRWLVKGFWTADGFGEIAGAEKTLKSYMATTIALAVASGRPLFGRFDVVTPGPVVIFTGEGSRHLLARRIQHLAKLFGLTPDETTQLPIAILDVPVQAQSEKFQNTLAAALVQRPVLVIVDPLYAFHGAETEAGNVYAVTPILRAMGDPCSAAGVALMIVNHTRKSAATNKEPTLTDITQAGHREWVHCWIMMNKRSEPTAEEFARQAFALSFMVGSREGYAGRYDLDIELGPLDMETMRHTGTPVAIVSEHQDTDKEADLRATILGILAVSPWTLTKTDLRSRLRGSQDAKLTAITELEITGRIGTRPEKRTRADGKARTVQVYGVLPVRADTPPDV